MINPSKSRDRVQPGDSLSLVMIVLLAVVAAGIPVILPGDFWIHVANEILLLGLFGMSFNLIYGYMGQISFGHAAYFGLGAYGTALSMRFFSVDGDIGYVGFFLSLLAAVPVAAIAAAVVGVLCVRLTGIYFAVLSMAFGELLYFVVFSSYSVTGGDNGMQGLLPPLALRDPRAYFYMSLAIVLAALVVMWLIVHSPFGYTLRAMRDNPRRTRFLGINMRLQMWINFVIAAAFAGMAGGLWGPLIRSISPSLLGWQHSGVGVIITLIGGAPFFAGPMLGAIIYTVLHAVVTSLTQYWPLTIGTVVLLIVLFSPDGVMGWLGALRERFARRRKREAGADEAVVRPGEVN
ncbi:branched-chain amino acid ABC transporter permease [Xanthobacter autotrophicus DSM 431]|uniref:branched-chain amino acid ABC transporter permease n=1 Tax=Xanthobacter nonsaccharivorans TaxID=3119912 RepID=UPI00372BDC65